MNKINVNEDGQLLRAQLLNHGIDFVNDIQTKVNALFDLNKSLEGARSAVAGRESAIYSEVSQQMKDGKPVFSNDASRKAEAVRIASGDAILEQMRKDMAGAEKLIAKAKASIDNSSAMVGLIRSFLHGG